MKISILTLFPELYEPFLKTSLVGRAKEKGLIDPELVNLFNLAKPSQSGKLTERIDSPSFGPGAGMLIKPEIIEAAVNQQETQFGTAFKIFFSPQGKKLNQKYLLELKNKIQNNHVLLLASRYEGIDERVEQKYADEVISLGDFVLMGGDLPAMCFLEGYLRLLPDIVGKQESVELESFSGPFLDYPEYTQPVQWQGMNVPEIVRSGNHAAINAWRQEQAAQKTIKNNFSWLKSSYLNKKEIVLVKQFIPKHYAVLMHGQVLLKDGNVGNTSVTSIDIHDIARSCATYGLENYFIVTPLIDQQKIVKTLLDFWNHGPGTEYNIHRTIAVNKVILLDNLKQVIEDIEKRESKKPILIATSAKKDLLYQDKYINYHEQSKIFTFERPVLIIFGTGHGLAKEVLDICDFILEPVYGFSDFNHLSVRSAVCAILDRWLGINTN